MTEKRKNILKKNSKHICVFRNKKCKNKTGTYSCLNITKISAHNEKLCSCVSSYNQCNEKHYSNFILNFLC